MRGGKNKLLKMDRLSPGEIAALKQAAHSAYQSMREKNPNIRFAKPGGEDGVLPSSENSSLQEEAHQAALAMGSVRTPSGGWITPKK